MYFGITKFMLAASLAVVLLTACGKPATENIVAYTPPEQPSRFTEDDNIITDKETGCKYLFLNSRSVMPLLKKDATPDCGYSKDTH